MRISDWSSDVCSSDLHRDANGFMLAQPRERPDGDRRSMIAAENISAILLAAGGSRRFGTSDKLLAPVAGAPLALHAAARIMELAPGRRIAVCPDGDGPLARRLDRKSTRLNSSH